MDGNRRKPTSDFDFQMKKLLFKENLVQNELEFESNLTKIKVMRN